MNVMSKGRVFVLALGVMACAVTTAATVIVVPGDRELITRSDAIVIGTVSEIESRDLGGRLVTDIGIGVQRTLKGEHSPNIVLREPGGSLPTRTTIVHGAPSFVVGERVLLFLTRSSDGTWQTLDLFAGKFSERTDRNERAWNRASDGCALLLSKTSDALQHRRSSRDFETMIEDVVAGREAMRAIEQTHSPAPFFTLFDDDAVRRWFSFDRREVVAFRAVGEQKSFEAGGRTLLSAAINSWNESGSAVKLHFDDAAAGATGIGQSDGGNDILFGDPLGEIPGSWVLGGSGVVARTALTVVRSPAVWTSPFFADSNHRFATFETPLEIIEANIVVQDGVAQETGIRPSVLAEVLAHEIGHALGLGHSGERGALMYPSIAGVGPALRDDDRLAARWLYPIPSALPSLVPAAPSSLTSSRMQDGSLDLRWTDRSENESVFVVEAATGAAPFRVASELPPNTTQTRLAFSGPTMRIRIVAANIAGSSPPSNEVVVDLTREAAMMVVPDEGTVRNTEFLFVDSTADVVTRSWDFGDGSTSTSAKATHSYRREGDYVVTLTDLFADGSIARGKKTLRVVHAPQRWVIGIVESDVSQGRPVKTELLVRNNGSTVESYLFRFHDASGGDRIAERTVEPKQMLVILDVIPELFGLKSGAGVVTIEADTVEEPAIFSRTYVESAEGTYGHALPAIPLRDVPRLVLGVSAAAADEQAKLVVVNASNESVNAVVRLSDSKGSPVSTRSVVVPPHATTTVDVETNHGEASGIEVVPSRPAAISAFLREADDGDEVQVSGVAALAAEQSFPVAGNSKGAGGFLWSTAVEVTNGGGAGEFDFHFALRDSELSFRVGVNAGETLSFEDIGRKFGISEGTGTLVIRGGGSALPVATTRITRATETGPRVGHLVDAVSAGDYSSSAVIVGLREDSVYRSNVGFVQYDADVCAATVTLLNGGPSDVRAVFLRRGITQLGVAALFQRSPDTMLAMGIATPQCRTFTYGAVIDRRSGDSTYVTGTPLD